jgi:DNA-binding LacI/PurR family transcriptional regulator
MRDVAKKARTSVFTVSSVVNNTYPVSPKLKRRVIKAIKELNYTPNSIARSLKNKKSFLVGLIISDIEDIFFPKVIKGIENIINKTNFHMILCNTMNDPEKEKKYLQIMVQKRVDGLILFPASSSEKNLIRFLERKIPIVLIDREILSINISTVVMNDYDASFNVTNYLIEKGHKHIGIVVFPNLISTGEKRLRGYIDALEKKGIELDQNLIKITGFKVEEAFRATNELLNLKNRPTALFTANDIMFSGAIKAINSKNLKIPDDISIITFYDFNWLKYLSPPITAVKLPTFEMGQQAAELLLEMIGSNEKKYYRKIMLKTKFIERNSVKDLKS